jgi:predicted HicB family RNase H-like nuclease
LSLRKKINITIDEDLLAQLQEEAKRKNLSLSRLIENKLKKIEA